MISLSSSINFLLENKPIKIFLCWLMPMASSSLLLPIGSMFVKRHQITDGDKSRTLIVRCSGTKVGVESSKTRGNGDDMRLVNRRNVLGLGLGVSSLFVNAFDASGAGLPPEEKPKLCDADCEKELENVPMVTTESGLQYKDIKVGLGPSPPVGFQVGANYVAMVPSGQIFDSSLEKGQIYIFRVGSGQAFRDGVPRLQQEYHHFLEFLFWLTSPDAVIKGLDEGLLSMKRGGKRRLYIPGPLAFPKGLNSAPGRPRVAANSPVIFDVSLEYIPGLDEEDEE